MMWKKVIPCILLGLGMLICAFAQAETNPVSEAEIADFAERMLELAGGEKPLNDPTAEDALSEDGYAYQYDFGVVYRDAASLTEETRANAILVMDQDIEGPRGIRIDWDVNRLMEAVPCENGQMYGTYEEAALYLQGDPDSGFLYGRVHRDGQRISAMEYGAVNPAEGRVISLALEISGDGISSMRMEGLQDTIGAEDARNLYRELEELTRCFAYARVPRSLDGTQLTMFSEEDLDFMSLSYLTADPRMFGDNVEDMLIDNEDGTWLRRVDGEGFEAVFSCDSQGENALLVSYMILSPELEGPRGVRLGDLFHEDFTRFRSGEGEMDASGQIEVLYGTPGIAPYGLAEYGNGSEMTLRYITPVLGRPDVELILRYEDTVLTEIILHTLEEDGTDAD